MFSRELRWPMTYMLVARLCWSCGLHANTRKNNVETKNIVHKQTIQVFNNDYSTCSRDEDLSRRAFVLARFRLRTPKVWRIVHGMLLYCTQNISGVVRLIDGHYLLAISHVAVLNRIITYTNGRAGPGALTFGGISVGRRSWTGRDMAKIHSEYIESAVYSNIMMKYPERRAFAVCYMPYIIR